MDAIPVWLGVATFALVVVASAWSLLTGRVIRHGFGGRESWPAGRVRAAALGTLLMGAGGVLQVVAYGSSASANPDWRLFLAGAAVFVAGAGVALPVYLRSRSRPG